jgi:hypothetical protein
MFIADLEILDSVVALETLLLRFWPGGFFDFLRRRFGRCTFCGAGQGEIKHEGQNEEGDADKSGFPKHGMTPFSSKSDVDVFRGSATVSV